MKKKLWHLYLIFLWKLQQRITKYTIDKWFSKKLFDEYGFLTDLKDDRNKS